MRFVKELGIPSYLSLLRGQTNEVDLLIWLPVNRRRKNELLESPVKRFSKVGVVTF